jgi:hypothetical protein
MLRVLEPLQILSMLYWDYFFIDRQIDTIIGSSNTQSRFDASKPRHFPHHADPSRPNTFIRCKTTPITAQPKSTS